MDREEEVKKALSDFLQQHNLHEAVSCVDEIVLTYLLSILDELGDTDNTEDNVDAEHFCEMMAAYMPGFENINSVGVWEWMFSLSGKLTGKSKDEKETVLSSSSVDAGNGDTLAVSGKVTEEVGRTLTKHRDRNSQSDGDDVKPSVSDGGVSEFDSQVALLSEMFPDTCAMEARHCVSVSHGQIDEAVQLILHRQETGNSIIEPGETNLHVRNKGCMLADKQLKELTLARYSFVDTDDDKKTHKPPPLKQESKKLIRYREGQVVSTKGERFSEVKKNESEEMKKTYVSLKPARKYRFH
ncbi:CUE domain-containing protein 2-like [Haliotis cracherodii]|uniref:CUE domain-containing protein 2-like n=1 Tax=Haliotis cracherodii TaxID=6455 RepID=UPI0039EAAE1A